MRSPVRAYLSPLLLAIWPGQVCSAQRPPNVVVIVVDDLGYMDISPNNPESLYDTPNLDRLAAEGVRFTDGYAACPVCSPTRYSLMTGRYPTRAGLTNYFSGRRVARFRPAESGDRMALDEVTVAEALRPHGYRTFFAGKWHLGPSEEFWPEAQGFEVNRGGHRAGGPYGGDKYFSPYGNPRLADGERGEHLPDRLAQETCEFMRQNQGEPFLAWLSFYSVHTPLMGRQDLVQKYRERVADLRQEGEVEFGPEEQTLPVDRPRGVRLLQRHVVYAAMVEAMDLAVGRVLDELDALGLADETVVVFTSDNGGLSTSEGSPTSNLPLRGGKGWLYEGGIREPWIVRAPGMTKAGSTCSVPICSIDLLPTVVELCGLPAVEHELDGLSFAPLVEGRESTALEQRPLFWHYPHYGNQGGFPGGAVRLGSFKLVERLEDGQIHLFDLSQDLGEQADLATIQPERATQLRALLHGFYRRFDAQFLRDHKGNQPWRPEFAR
jgi:arylsulfatase A-like enzyme